MYARVLRKWSLAKFLMYLWLFVIMLLVICCQNATSMHLVKNARSSRSTSPYSLASVNTMPSNSELGSSTMTIYSPYGRFIDPYRNQLRQFQQAEFNQLRRESYNSRLDEVQQPQQQLSVIDGIQQRQYYSPYTIYIRTNADTAKVNGNVPNMNSQIINLNSNSYATSSTYSSKERMPSAPQQNGRDQGLLNPKESSSSNLRYLDNKPGHVQYTFSHRGKTRERRQGENTEELPSANAKSSVSVLSAQSQQSEPSTFDPIRPPADWLQSQNARKLRIERHRQRRHRHFEQIAREESSPSQNPISDQSNSNKSSPISTSTISLSNTTTITNNSNIKDKSDDSRSYKSFDSQSGTRDSNHGEPIVNFQNRMIDGSVSRTRSLFRRRMSRSHHPRRRRRYCSARDPVQLAYLAPIVLEGKVRSMSTNRRANFSVTFEVTQIFKNRQNHNIRKHDLVRLQFTFSNTTGECGDIYQEKFRERGLIKRELQNGRNYTLFLKYDGEKFRILGEPTMSNQRVYGYVKNASQEKFGKPASIKLLTANKNKIREKEELRIVCIVRGNPPPKITWFKDDKSIKQSRQQYQFNNRKRKSELIVKSFSNATAGLYECRAKNRVMVNKKVEKKTIRIEAYGRPETHNDTGEDCVSSMAAYCLNGGVCRFFSDISQYYCKCADGFEGDRCQEKRPTNVSLNQTVTGYMADSPTDTMSEESDENFSLSSSDE